MKAGIVIIAVLSFNSGCVSNSSHARQADFGRFNEQLDQLDKAMADPLPELQFSNGVSAHNCREYLEFRNTVDLVETVENQARSSEYRICTTLQVLQTAEEVNQPYRSDTAAGEVLRTRLDLRSFRSSLGPASDHYHTLADMEGEVPVRVEDESVTLDSDDWYLQLEVVARADLDSDGREDWLVWLTDEARDGNYRGYEVLAIYNVAQTGLLEATPVSD